MRGAVALALALHMEVDTMETKRVILTSTLFMILFTIVFMGGSALPLIKVRTKCLFFKTFHSLGSHRNFPRGAKFKTDQATTTAIETSEEQSKWDSKSEWRWQQFHQWEQWQWKTATQFARNFEQNPGIGESFL